MLTKFDREVLLWLLVIALTAWIVWTEIRPFILTLIEKKGAIKIHENLHCVERRMEVSEEGQPLREHYGNELLAVFYLQIANNRNDGKTIRNVKAQVRTFSDIIPLQFWDGEASIDLQKGDLALARLGSMITNARLAILDMSQREQVDRSTLQNFVNRAKHGYKELRIGPKFGVAARESDPPMPLYVVVTADDVPPAEARLGFQGWAKNGAGVLTVTVL